MGNDHSCFEFELYTEPLSLFDEKELMGKTKKSAFYELFNIIPERPMDFPNYYY